MRLAGVDAVGQPAPLAHLDEQPGGHAAAEDQREQAERVAAVVEDAGPGKASTAVHCSSGSLRMTSPPAVDHGWWAAAASRLQAGIEAAESLHQPVMVDVAGGGDDQGAGR